MKKYLNIRNLLLYAALLLSVIAIDIGVQKILKTFDVIQSHTKAIASLQEEIRFLRSEAATINATINETKSLKPVTTALPEPLPLPSTAPLSKSEEVKTRSPVKITPQEDGKFVLLSDDAKMPVADPQLNLLREK